MRDRKNPLWYTLKEEDRRKLTEFYKEQFGTEFMPPDRDGRIIRLATKLEDLEEIDRRMRQKPNPRRGLGR